MTLTLEHFEACRPLLFSIAYRMLGSVVEAEDVVQEAFLRYQAASPESVQRPRAFLSTVVTRLCLDQLKSARARRETYPGTWLPEPLRTDGSGLELDPDEHVGTLQSVSMAFLVLLESLTPIERAVFLLHEVFDYSYPEVATIVGKSEDACRQLFHRARQAITDRRPRFVSSAEAQRRLTDTFIRACMTGDLEGLMSLLAEDITLWADGGGEVHSAPRPVEGRARVARFLLGIARKSPSDLTFEPAQINGEAGFISRAGGAVMGVFVLEVDDGIIRGIRVVVNPDKLARIAS